MLHRPAAIPVPAFALRLALGQFAEEILGGQRALPTRLSAAGFEFGQPTLEEALRVALS
jgi:NAD dependent epimerase/dehydratase family enzyme